MAITTMKDVAARAGASLGTVSNVLNRPDLVTPATRRRVEEAIAELGYVRNDSARQLRAGASRIVAYVVIDAGNPFFTEVARGIDDGARAQLSMVFICDSGSSATREDDYLAALLEQRVKGVCITPVNAANPRLRQLVDRGLPVIMVDRTPFGEESKWCSVGVDDILGGDLATTHVLDLGHIRVAYVGDTQRFPQSMDRLAGARRAAARAGLPPDALRVLPTTTMRVDDGREAGSRFLGLPKRERPTAAFCGNDLIALGFLQQMTRHGVSVPGDLAIVGYDDIEFAAAAAVPLTSVEQPKAEIGRMAAELLAAEAIQAADHIHRQVQLVPQLVVRESTLG
ncbi:MAG: LacI family DNA-binding transcriptional regulator [Tetrasphaera sp.]